MQQVKLYLDMLEGEASQVNEELAPSSPFFAQTALHPLLLRAPFVFRPIQNRWDCGRIIRWSTSYWMTHAKGRSTYFQM